MNLALLFANKMRQQKQDKSSVSARIINIAMIAVAVGISMILIAVATAKGMQKEIRKKTVAFNGHVVVSPFENNESQISMLPFEDTEALRAEIQDSNIDRLVPVILKPGMLRKGADFEGIVFKGVDSLYQWKDIQGFLIVGRFPNFANNGSEEILISATVASRISVEIGDRVNAYFQNEANQNLPNQRRFTVVGIYNSGFPEVDETLIFGDIHQLRRLNKWEANAVGAYEIFLKNDRQMASFAAALYNRIPSDLNTVPINEKFSSIFQWISLFDFNIAIILVVMILVGLINMATALLVLILERSRMIGVLKAMGAPNALIQKIFMYNGVLIMAKGLFFGNLLGLAFYFSQRTWGWITLDPQTYYLSVAPVILTVSEVLSLNLIFLSVCVILLWLPAQIVLTIAPSKVLRFR